MNLCKIKNLLVPFPQGPSERKWQERRDWGWREEGQSGVGLLALKTKSVVIAEGQPSNHA
jgi:hypothetical protein